MNASQESADNGYWDDELADNVGDLNQKNNRRSNKSSIVSDGNSEASSVAAYKDMRFKKGGKISSNTTVKSMKSKNSTYSKKN